jgi:hypothetical protein
LIFPVPVRANLFLALELVFIFGILLLFVVYNSIDFSQLSAKKFAKIVILFGMAMQF